MLLPQILKGKLGSPPVHHVEKVKEFRVVNLLGMAEHSLINTTRLVQQSFGMQEAKNKVREMFGESQVRSPGSVSGWSRRA